eukprot:TRINITY_DN1876_c0_g1_i2.p1 TRINITY_DN1876_c0_g1~~TRINITY_DN1876_c0_g1_i2.p1  ORF type:complete len:602 (-),score=165.04 TRINITY_DN1876_c0_g1_i2:22-1788(-)
MWNYYNVLLETAKTRRASLASLGVAVSSPQPKVRDQKDIEARAADKSWVAQLAQSAAGKQWQNIGIKHHHGIVVPLFSLHSAQTHGVGDFASLEMLLPWVRSLDMDVVQLLPLNEANRDNSPFSGMSAFALDPIFLSLYTLPNIDKYGDLKQQLVAIHDQLEPKDGAVRHVDYPAVRDGKRQFVAKYLENERENILNSEGYKAYYEREKQWLDGYALFKILKCQNEWKAWWEWPEDQRNPKHDEDLKALKQKYTGKEGARLEDEMIVQYLCYQQMKQVKTKGQECGVHLKGDVPYLISRDSADAWLPQSRRFFNPAYSAGAPPDAGNAEGQNWGMPVYDWDALAADGYSWWKERLRVAEDFYSIYRIDHIVGFFRVWGVEQGKSGKEGKYLPEDESKWGEHGEKHLRLMLENSNMLPIGEDLGTLPDCCRPTLAKLGICGTKVVIWEREWTKEDEGQPFIPFDEYPKCSMTTVATHDSEPLRMWWERNPEQAESMCSFLGLPQTQKLSREDHKLILRNAHHSGSLFHVNPLMEFLPLVDGLVWDSLDDERVNIPGKLLDTNWAYCYRPSVEEIIANKELKDNITSCMV